MFFYFVSVLMSFSSIEEAVIGYQHTLPSIEKTISDHLAHVDLGDNCDLNLKTLLPDHCKTGDGLSQDHLLTKIKIIGADNRAVLKRSSDVYFQKQLNAIGVISCYNKSGKLKPVGTATIVVPELAKSPRDFETLYTAKHLFFNSDGTRRTGCVFQSHGGKGKRVSISLAGTGFKENEVFGLAGFKFKEVSSDGVIVKINRRLTNLDASKDGVLPWRIEPLSQVTYFNNDKMPSKAERLDLDEFKYIESITAIGYDPKRDKLMAATGSERKNSWIRGVIKSRDPNCVLGDFREYQASGDTRAEFWCDTVKGMSGGPILRIEYEFEKKKVRMNDGSIEAKWDGRYDYIVSGVVSGENQSAGVNYASMVTPKLIASLQSMHPF